MKIDLIYDGTNIIAVVWEGDKIDHIGPIPVSGSFGVIADELVKRYLEEFPTRERALIDLTRRHTRNLSAGKNTAGQDYPLKK